MEPYVEYRIGKKVYQLVCDEQQAHSDIEEALAHLRELADKKAADAAKGGKPQVKPARSAEPKAADLPKPVDADKEDQKKKDEAAKDKVAKEGKEADLPKPVEIPEKFKADQAQGPDRFKIQPAKKPDPKKDK